MLTKQEELELSFFKLWLVFDVGRQIMESVNNENS